MKLAKRTKKYTARGLAAARKREAKARDYAAANKAHGTSGRRGRKS